MIFALLLFIDIHGNMMTQGYEGIRNLNLPKTPKPFEFISPNNSYRSFIQDPGFQVNIVDARNKI